MIPDLQYALRQLARAPGFTLLVVVCLALGIGVNVATFGAIDALLLRPPSGLHDVASLRRLRVEMPPAPGQQIFFDPGFSTRDVEALRARRETFASLASFSAGASFVEGAGIAEKVEINVVGADYFAALGVRPALGRLIAGGEAGVTSQAPVAVASHAFWRRALGGDPAAVGRSLRVGGRVVTVIGVAPPGFGGTELQPAALFLPLGFGTVIGYDRRQLDDPAGSWLTLVTRLAPGVDPQRAGVVAATVLAGVDAAQPKSVHALSLEGPRLVRAAAMHEYWAAALGASSPIPVWLLGATAAVLVVVCANVANLLLLRAERRRREIATRLAVGASRGRVARQLFTEGIVLALLGGTLGVVVAVAGARLFRLVPSMPAIERIVDDRALWFGCGVTMLTTLAFALTPSVLATRGGSIALLRSGARGTARRRPLQAALLIVQFAAALAMLGVGGLFVRSLRNVDAIDVGFDAERTLVATVDWRAFGIAPGEAREALARAQERLRAVGGVEGATLAMLAPFSGASMSTLHVPVRTAPAGVSGVPGGMFFANVVDTAYFRTMGMPLVRGRGHLPLSGGTEREIVVSETFARRVFANADAIGRCVTRKEGDSTCLRIVGVVRDVRYLSVVKPPAPIFYGALDATKEEPTTLLVRLRADADDRAVRAGVGAVRATLTTVEPRIRFASVAPVADGMLRQALGPYRLAATAFTAFGALALLMAAVGLYGVIAYAVTQRTGEFGVRMALGARSADLRRLVIRQGARTALVGGVVGVVLAVAIGRALRSRLYGVEPLDPMSLLPVAALLALVTVVAAAIPARRAARVDPVVALRAE